MPVSPYLPDQTDPVFCHDEDIAVRAGGDFVNLCPPWQVSAAGMDGVFAAGSPWILTSATVDFEANGVLPNQVMHLTAPPAQFPGGGHLLAVDAVAGGSVTLRRLHGDTAVGQPPAPAAGLTGVKFSVPTLIPQIEESSFDLKRRFGVDESLSVRSSGYLYDDRELRTATVLTVLLGRYTQEARAERGDFRMKIDLIRDQLGDVLGRVQVRWGSRGQSAPAASVWGARVVR